jgi:hypothetical protein
MYDIGSDTIAERPNGVGPAGPAHAVDRDGVVLCRGERARYHFPWLDWMGESTPDDERAAACPDCAAIALERALPAAAIDDPYPITAAVESIPVQPAIDWLRLPQDFSVWSDGLA